MRNRNIHSVFSLVYYLHLSWHYAVGSVSVQILVENFSLLTQSNWTRESFFFFSFETIEGPTKSKIANHYLEMEDIEDQNIEENAVGFSIWIVFYLSHNFFRWFLIFENATYFIVFDEPSNMLFIVWRQTWCRWFCGHDFLLYAAHMLWNNLFVFVHDDVLNCCVNNSDYSKHMWDLFQHKVVWEYRYTLCSFVYE